LFAHDALINRWTVASGSPGRRNFKIKGDHDGEPRESGLRTTATGA
jgi:hypothetical protein